MWEERKLPLQRDLIVPILSKYLALPVCYCLEDQMGATAEGFLLLVFFQGRYKSMKGKRGKIKGRISVSPLNVQVLHLEMVDYLDFD